MTLPSLFIPHGGGPCFFMNWTMGPANTWDRMADWLRGLAAGLPERPKGIVVISGHWEEAAFTVSTMPNPDMIFDYSGFPPHTYALSYPAPGSGVLAERVRSLLAEAGLPTATDATRGFDHGIFVPFLLAFPDADIPVVPLSLKSDLDPAEHLAAGRALAALRDEGVLIVGSGMSFHNLRARGPQVTPIADEWDAALTAAVTDPDPAKRAERVTRWSELPYAQFAHPEAEHLLPLMVALGAGGEGPAVCEYRDHVLGWTISGYRFG